MTLHRRLSWLLDWMETFPQVSLLVLLIMGIRAFGGFESQELALFDWTMKQRLPERKNEKIVLVGITEDDIRKEGQYPLSDSTIAQGLRTIFDHHPSVVGLDLFKDQLNNPGRDELGEVFKAHQNLIGIEVALNWEESLNVKPPPDLPKSQVGLADALVDSDDKLRRVILSSYDWEGRFHDAFAVKLVLKFFEQNNLAATQRDNIDVPLVLETQKIHRFNSMSGGYHEADAQGHQLVLNYSSAKEPFHFISLGDILTGNFDPLILQDKIVLFGMMAPSVKDTFNTGALKQTYLNPNPTTESESLQLYGLEIHGHLVHELLERIFSNRPQIYSLPEWAEYSFIALFGLMGFCLGTLIRSSWVSFLGLSIALGLMTLSSILAISVGLWLPWAPAMWSLSISGLTTALVDRELKRLLIERKRTIESTFNIVHNGPLQSLAAISRSLEQSNRAPDDLAAQIRVIDQDLRQLFGTIGQEALSKDHRLYLQTDLILDLRAPLSEILYELIDHTLERPLPNFSTLINTVLPDFSCLDHLALNLEKKRNFCLFVEECLCNCGKHASGLTTITIRCQEEAGQYEFSIQDNGQGEVNGDESVNIGQGTTQAHKLAHQFRGTFVRRSRTHGRSGTECLLRWQVTPWSQLRFKLSDILFNKTP